MSADVRVLAVGSPRGDDSAALLLAPELTRRLAPLGAQVLALDRPGPSLVAHLAGGRAVVLVDAVLTGAPVGTLHRFTGEAVCGAARSPLSGHGLGLADALELARALASLPEHLVLWGVEGDPAAGDTPSPALRAALPELLEAVTREVAALLPTE